jgi:hypothetical protein
VESESASHAGHAEGAHATAAAPLWLIVIGLPLLLCVLAWLLFCLLIILGGVRMMSLRSYGLAVTAAILALLPCQPLFLLGLIFGIWALIVLSRPSVKAAFATAG